MLLRATRPSLEHWGRSWPLRPLPTSEAAAGPEAAPELWGHSWTLRPFPTSEATPSPKVDNGLMNVNKLNKEVPHGPWIPFPTISPSSSGPISPRRGRDKSVCCTRAYVIYPAYFRAQEEQEAQSSLSSTYPFIGLSHEMKDHGRQRGRGQERD